MLSAGVILVSVTINAMAQPVPNKIKPLPPTVEQQWIAALRSHKTKDGTTVAEVLRFAERMRPREFKSGDFNVYYNATGEANGVGIVYWLGAKRLPGDAYHDLGYSVRVREGGGLDVEPGDWPFSKALEEGRDTFLSAVDDEYATQCTDFTKFRKSC